MSSYFEPCPGIGSGTTSIPVVRPNLAAPTALGAGVGAYVYGAAVQIVAAADLAAHMLIAIAPHYGGSTDDWQLELRSAAGGGGTLFGEWAFSNNMAVWWAGTIPVVPAITLPANSAVFGRVASGAGSNTFMVKLIFIPRPIA